MILIDNILVSDEIFTTKFSCELSECKGACCTFPGEYGAPVLDEEVAIIEDCLSVAFEYLPQKSIAIIKEKGFIEGSKGDFSTACIDKKDCVFVYYDSDIAKCALERAYFDGKIKFRKPLSCHLFPIRISDFGGDYLYYDEFTECKTALIHGEAKNTYIFENVKDALIRAYGTKWYNLLNEYSKNQKD